MRKDKACQKNRQKKLMILCQQPKVVIMGWQSYLYWKFPDFEWDLRACMHFLHIQNGDVQRPKSLTYLENHVRSILISASFSLWSPSFSLQRPCSLLYHVTPQGHGTGGSLCLKLTLPHMSEWLTSSSSWNLCSNVVGKAHWLPFYIADCPYPLI